MKNIGSLLQTQAALAGAVWFHAHCEILDQQMQPEIMRCFVC